MKRPLVVIACSSLLLVGLVALIRYKEGEAVNAERSPSTAVVVERARTEIARRAGPVTKSPVEMREAIYRAEASGDFSSLREGFLNLPQQERYTAFLESILRVESKLGIVHDYREKSGIVDLEDGRHREVLAARLLREVGAKLQKPDVAAVSAEVSIDDWKEIIRASASKNPVTTLEFSSEVPPGEKRDALVETSVLQLLEQDSNAASGQIQSIEDRSLRDLAWACSVGWLAEKGALEEAKGLASYIEDEQLRAKAIGLLEPRQNKE